MSSSSMVLFQDALQQFYKNKQIKAQNAAAKRKARAKLLSVNSEEEPDNDDEDENTEGDDTDLAEAFFELANAAEIGYQVMNYNCDSLEETEEATAASASDRKDEDDDDGDSGRKINNQTKKQKKTIPVDKKKEEDCILVFRQTNNSNQQQECLQPVVSHTGGIIWETSFLLLEYIVKTNFLNQSMLVQPQPKSKCNKQQQANTIVEVGAGLGFLGVGLAAHIQVQRIASLSTTTTTTKVNAVPNSNNNNINIVLTDTDPVVTLLRNNVERNRNALEMLHHQYETAAATTYVSSCPPVTVTVSRLDWEHCERDIVTNDDCSEEDTNPENQNNKQPLLTAHCATTILGTDVIFSPQLVRPLLHSLTRLASKQYGCHAYLCLQERCVTSFQLLLELASQPQYGGWTVQDQTNDMLNVVPWGRELDCRLICLIKQPEKEEKDDERQQQKDEAGQSKKKKKRHDEKKRKLPR